ncbi:hypothetical protein JCM17846_10540 [Iodidimonas nitroreducens]|uniref:Uncharacterized protein n=2 Tax=Iodidimonas nitroreducens TaxID=1236968 RepID=A0A5A7N504_9PROT|nr:hypothetical protein JCM17846_10540 [Iodidimonas nitroreducens]
MTGGRHAKAEAIIHLFLPFIMIKIPVTLPVSDSFMVFYAKDFAQKCNNDKKIAKTDEGKKRPFCFD